MKTKRVWFAVFCVSLSGWVQGASAAPRIVRATELSQKALSDLGSGQEILIEFRQGDRLPVNLEAKGDLLETTEVNPSYVIVRRPFWLKFDQSKIQMSLDGTQFKPVDEMVSGNFTAGASSSGHTGGGPANAINLLFKANLK